MTIGASAEESRRGLADGSAMTSLLVDPWMVDVHGFPSDADLRARLNYAVRFAILAPSSHNSQPWLFRVCDSHVDVVCDRTRALPVVDPDDRELVISCGAALFTLRLALVANGLREHTTIMPDPIDFDVIARVAVVGNAAIEPRDVELFEAVANRVTSRGPFLADGVPEAVVAELRDAATREGAWLSLHASEGERADVGSLVARGDLDQFADERFRRELALWMHHRRSGDGLAVRGVQITRALIRTFDLGGRRARTDRDVAEGAPLLAVVGTPADGVRDWIAAGQAIARVLLVAQRAGLAAGFLNQPIEVPELRPQLAALTGQRGLPQLLLRLGYPDSRHGIPLHTPRRQLGDVLLDEDAA